MRVLVLVIALLLTASCTVRRERVLKDLDTRLLFGRWEGCAVIVGPKGTEVYNPARASVEFPPCSTFKIVNSLIALETGAVESLQDEFRWDGVPRERNAENRDHTLESAFRASILWVYQEVARRITLERMTEWMDQLGYGNGDISGGLTEFWLMNSLKISARGQVTFLRRLQERTLPMGTDTQTAVLELMRNGEEGGVILRGKTGSGRATPKDAAIGWYVGIIEGPDGVTTFAVNMGGEGAWGQEARSIALLLLKQRGYLPLEMR